MYLNNVWLRRVVWVKSSQFHFNGDINVHTMERQSGIFIGEHNHAVGWSAHGKQNSVIGGINGQSNLLIYNISILNDPDFIDTPIDDRDIHVSVDYQGEESTDMTLNLDKLNVTTMYQNSALFVGDSHVTGMDSNQKANFSQGSIYGDDNALLGNCNITNDSDLIDGIMDDKDVKIAAVNKF
jgi:hypothetical protein